MAENWFTRFFNGSNNTQKNKSDKKIINKFNEAFMKFWGVGSATYDNNNKTYLEKGYRINPIVFSVVNQMCDKSKSVPFYVKKIKDQKAYKKLKRFDRTVGNDLSSKQLFDRQQLKALAFEEEEIDFPMERPNPNQTWEDVISLYKLFLKTTGNFYLLKVSPNEGSNKGIPQLVYVLPSDKMELVLKKDADLLYDENPIDYYKLTDGEINIKFEKENIIHVKTPNPFYSQNGSHLYGLSPMASLLKNIESSNDALDNNIKTLKNSGVFGFLSAKDGNLTDEQATQLKQKLVDMDKSPGRLSKIAGLSTQIEFTRLSLDTTELQPFEFLKYDQKQICNVFGWSDLLLNSDSNMTYNNIKEERKRVITDNIKPDLDLLASALNDEFIPLFKGYENAEVEFDITELSEMQENIKEMIEWAQKAWLTPNEIRLLAKYETIDIDGMDVPRDPQGNRVDEISINETDINKSYKE